ncbi:MAG: helix-turn-helix domain-containing protein [Sedimentisphaerales bacterium]|nr:helix-turn-helix domain-containing protein [Sedimentisphaerales bacterium]
MPPTVVHYPGNGAYAMDEYVDLRLLSMRLQFSPRTLRSWVSDPQMALPAIKVRGKLLFRWRDVERWLEKFRVQQADVEGTVDQIITEIRKGRSKDGSTTQE